MKLEQKKSIRTAETSFDIVWYRPSYNIQRIEKANVDSASFTQRMNHMLHVIVLCYIVLKDTKE